MTALEAAGVEVLIVKGDTEPARVAAGLQELGAREVQSVLLEGGPHLAGAFLDAGEIDEARDVPGAPCSRAALELVERSTARASS